MTNLNIATNNLAPTANHVLTMSSREIAELTGKQHSNVMRDIRNMLLELKQNSNLNFVCNSVSYKAESGQEYPMYELDRDTTDTLLTGYSAVARMTVIKRWRELEGGGLPKDYPTALRLAADLYEKNNLLTVERDQAIATKAYISDKKTATAMNTASIKSKENEKLKQQLDESMQYATIKRMEKIHHGLKFNWRALKSTSKEMGLPPIDVFDPNFDTVKAYHRDVWQETYALDF